MLLSLDSQKTRVDHITNVVKTVRLAAACGPRSRWAPHPDDHPSAVGFTPLDEDIIQLSRAQKPFGEMYRFPESRIVQGNGFQGFPTAATDRIAQYSEALELDADKLDTFVPANVFTDYHRMLKASKLCQFMRAPGNYFRCSAYSSLHHHNGQPKILQDFGFLPFSIIDS